MIGLIEYMKIPFFVLIIYLNSLAAYGKSPIVHYSPETVSLEGVIELQTFPGRYNYESIAAGDEPEKGYYLRLSQSVDVVVSKNDLPADVAQTESNVKIMQLTWEEPQNLRQTIKDAIKLKKKSV
jgi:hypothetical protein